MQETKETLKGRIKTVMKRSSKYAKNISTETECQIISYGSSFILVE
jgi:hypothetical protein